MLIRDLSAAAENALLQITCEGQGGVRLGWYPNKGRVRSFMDAFGLPSHIVPFALIALGYPVKTPRPKDRFDPAKVYHGRYGQAGT
ncbi:MAG: hypothetical protein LBD31_00005 [Treponema sp.]|nr:hypothetical protein [Treponema sp.]